jgi:phosphoribosylaminoimidazole carboxylase PurE protein
MKNNILVPVILGSDKDMAWAEKITSELAKWKIPVKIHILSAHKVPEMLVKVIEKYNSSKTRIVYVTIAGRSNGLSGVTAGSSVHPVIACPPFASKEDMILNLNSTMQMPSDVPVLTVLDPVNCALAVVRILALDDPDLMKKYGDHLKKVKKSFKM